MTKSYDESLAEARRTFDPSTAKVLAGGQEITPLSPHSVTQESDSPKLSIFDEAKKLKAALDKIEARKAAVIAKTEKRAAELRSELIKAASPKAVAVLEAAESAT